MGQITNLSELRNDIKNGKDKAKAVQQLYSHFLNAQRYYRMQWLRNTAFARGIQHSVLDEAGQSLFTPRLPKGVKRTKDNQIGAWKRQLMARINTPHPKFEVIPKNFSAEEILKAQAGTAFLEHVEELNAWKELKYKISNNTIDFGNCFAYIRDFADPLRMTPMQVFDFDTDEQALDPETGKPMVEATNIVDISWGVLKPHNVFCTLDDSIFQDKIEVLTVFARDLSYVERVYNKKFKPSSYASSSYVSYDLSLLNKGRKLSSEVNKVNEIIYLQKPTDYDKKGKLMIIVGDEVMEDRDWPYEYCLDYPLTHIKYNEPPPGEFYAQSPIDDQISLQRDLNENLSIIQENITNVGHKKWGVPNGSGITSLDDISGELVRFNPDAGPPFQIEVKPLPQYEVMHPDRLRNELQDIQHYHSVSRGSGESSVRSEVGLNRLSEEDNTPLGVVDDFMAIALEDIARKTLRIGAEMLTVPQIIKYIGEGRRKIIPNFVGSMLDPDGNVKVRLIDTHLRNKTSAQNTIIELARHGLIMNRFGGMDRNRIQKAIEFAVPEHMFDVEDRQREIAYEENEEIMEGNPVIAQDFEFQFIHIEVVEELLNSREFKKEAKQNPKLMEAALEHRQKHLEILSQALQPQGNPEEEKQVE